MVAFNLSALSISDQPVFQWSEGWYREVGCGANASEQAVPRWQMVFEGLSLVLVLLLAGAVGGLRLGHAVNYGTALNRLRQLGISIRLVPGHPDDAAGLKPFGAFISFQALGATLPAFWLALWLLLIPHGDRVRMIPNYTHWVAGFIGILGLALVISLLAFFLPLRSLHQVMLNEKRACIGRNRQAFGQRIQQLYSSGTLSGATNRQLITSRKIENLQNQLFKIESLPEWPLEPMAIVRFLAIVFLTFFVPLVQNYEEYAQDSEALAVFFIFFGFLKNLLDILFD